MRVRKNESSFSRHMHDNSIVNHSKRKIRVVFCNSRNLMMNIAVDPNVLECCLFTIITIYNPQGLSKRDACGNLKHRACNLQIYATRTITTIKSKIAIANNAYNAISNLVVIFFLFREILALTDFTSFVIYPAMGVCRLNGVSWISPDTPQACHFFLALRSILGLLPALLHRQSWRATICFGHLVLQSILHCCPHPQTTHWHCAAPYSNQLRPILQC